MKKIILGLTIILGSFLMGMIDAKASSHIYDITSLRVVGSNLVIEGWAIYRPTPRDFKQHQVQPTFTLNVVDTSSNQLIMGPLEDKATKGNFVDDDDTKTSQATVFAAAYYHQYEKKPNVAKIYNDYAGSNQYRNRLAYYISITANEMYVNNHFRFQIPIQELNEKANALNAEELKLNLNISQTSGPVTVFGIPFNLPNINYNIIGLAAHSNVVTLPSDFDYVEVKTPFDKTTVVVSEGLVQGNTTQSVLKYYCGGSFGPAGWISYTDMSKWPNAEFRQHITEYPIIARHTAQQKYIRLGFQLGAYQMSFNPNIVAGKCYASPNGSIIGYIPSVWVSPVSGSFIRIIPTKIDEPEPEPEPEPTDPDCNFEDALVRYCCLYPEDDDLCNELRTRDLKSDSRSLSCSNSETPERFKYPKNPIYPYLLGESQLKNAACNVNCQETLDITFQPAQSVNAGMGFTYPVAVRGSRICAAAYKNESWVEDMNAAVEEAVNYYKDMKKYLDEAVKIDDECGDRDISTDASKIITDYHCDDEWVLDGVNCTKTYEVKSNYFFEADCKLPGPSWKNLIAISPFCVGNCNEPCRDNKPSSNSTRNEELSTCLQKCDIGLDEGTCNILWEGICNEEPKPAKKTYRCEEGWDYINNTCRKFVCEKPPNKDWNNEQSRIVSKLASANDARIDYQKYIATINLLNNDRFACNNWVSLNPYLRNPATTINTNNVPNQNGYSLITPIVSYSNLDYKREGESKEHTIEVCNEGKIEAASYNRRLRNNHQTISNFFGEYCNDFDPHKISYQNVWVENSISDLTYEFSNFYYIQRYTGEISDTNKDGYDRHGRYAYTGFYDPSMNHSFSIRARNLGPNLTGVTRNWHIDPLNCHYEVTNWLFPPENDPQREKYGAVTFTFRQISLTDPFPNRSPRTNWLDRENLINDFANFEPYHIELTPGLRQSIRLYNRNSNYGSFNIEDPYRSLMIRNLGGYTFK